MYIFPVTRESSMSLDLSKRMLDLGAEYVNLDVVYSSERNIFLFAARAAKIAELAEGTSQNHSYVIDLLGDFLI